MFPKFYSVFNFLTTYFSFVMQQKPGNMDVGSGKRKFLSSISSNQLDDISCTYWRWDKYENCLLLVQTSRPNNYCWITSTSLFDHKKITFFRPQVAKATLSTSQFEWNGSGLKSTLEKHVFDSTSKFLNIFTTCYNDV